MKYILLVALAAALFVTACTTTTTQTEIETPTLSTPEFELQTIDGETISSDSGKPTLIYFMASWCPSCAKNWEALSAVAPEYENEVNFFAISIDPSDTASVLSELSEKNGFAFNTVAGNPQFANSLNVRSQTSVIGLTSEGEQVIKTAGVFSEDEWREMFESVQ